MVSSVLEKLLSVNDGMQSIQHLSDGIIANCETQEKRLRESLRTVAELIERGNEKLWPIFDKLEEELTRLEQKEERLSRYSRFQ